MINDNSCNSTSMCGNKDCVATKSNQDNVTEKILQLLENAVILLKDIIRVKDYGRKYAD
jgi:hypothetical protein